MARSAGTYCPHSSAIAVAAVENGRREGQHAKPRLGCWPFATASVQRQQGLLTMFGSETASAKG